MYGGLCLHTRCNIREPEAVRNVEDTSEYQQKFPWRESKLSAAYKPSADEVIDPAGVPSTNMCNVMEPPLQRRKKPVYLSSDQQMNGKGNHYSDDYFLLGDQKKFGSSIKYRNRSKFEKNIKNTQKAENLEEKVAEEKVYSPGPAPKVIVTTNMTGAPAQKKEKKANKATETNGIPVDQDKDDTPKETPKAPRKEKHYKEPIVNGNILKEYKPVAKQDKKSGASILKNKANIPKASHSAPEIRKKEDTLSKKADLVKAPPEKPVVSKGVPDRRTKRKGQMNEFVQTNLDKGLADSSPEAPANYAMKYKAGIPPPRPKSNKRLSEYQLQFKWRDAVPSAPLIAAEQVVYNSNPQVAPYKPDRVPKVTEYRAEFHPWDNYRPAPKEDVKDTKQTAVKKTELKRSQSAESVTNEVKTAAGSQQVTNGEDKRLVKSSMNPQKLHFPHGKLRNSMSEYQCNFVEPAKFSYDNGVWKGADPPHIQPQKEESPVAKSASTQSSWYSEVMELRKKAAEYKKRAQGTHFSKEHLAQLYAKQAEIWDMVSNRSTLSALSLERPTRKKIEEDTSETGSAPSVVDAWAEDDQEDDYSVSSPSNRTESTVTMISEESSTKGRLPTPTLRQSGSSRRHHLDRTTPVLGGNLLSSPPQSKTKLLKEKPEDAGSDYPTPKVTPKKAQESSSAPAVLQQPKTTPTYGMPTRDTHLLVDDDASQDRPLQTEFVHSPAKPRVKPAGIPTTILERSQESFSAPQAWADAYSDVKKGCRSEDDILSTSARSLASSASLASETLRRAQKHRQEFWGKK